MHLKEIFARCKNVSMDHHILQCQAEIAKRYDRLLSQRVNSEAVVRYVYGDPIIDMLVDSFNYKLQIEETVLNENYEISDRSRTDYCCWRIYKQTSKESKPVCVTVLETKHPNLRTKHQKHFTDADITVAIRHCSSVE